MSRSRQIINFSELHPARFPCQVRVQSSNKRMLKGKVRSGRVEGVKIIHSILFYSHLTIKWHLPLTQARQVRRWGSLKSVSVTGTRSRLCECKIDKPETKSQSKVQAPNTKYLLLSHSHCPISISLSLKSRGRLLVLCGALYLFYLTPLITPRLRGGSRHRVGQTKIYSGGFIAEPLVTLIFGLFHQLIALYFAKRLFLLNIQI